MSTPSFARRPDDTGPALRAAKGFVCPKCRRRFEEAATGNPTTCPDDKSPLVRVRDMVEADGDPLLGRTLDGRFTILAKLGAGSMGTVYRAKQHAVGRDIAVKILRSDRSVDSAAKGRFLREARANSVLTSPHTVTVFDFGQSETGELYLAMELLEGESLGQRLKRQTRVAVDQSVETTRQALRSLAEAHAKGIIHRDLKPDNLFYAKVRNGGQSEEIVKVVDFGIAKMLHDEGEQMNAVETQAGTVFGTPRYMSPEQAQGKPLDARSDLYSLGVILYHMITGRPPFTDDDAIVVMARHIKTMPRPPSEVAPDVKIPAELEAVLMRCLAKEPAQRPDTADAMGQELMRALDLDIAGSSGVRHITTAPQAFALAVGNDRSRVPSLPPATPAPALPDDSLTLAASGASRGRGVAILVASVAFVSVLAAALIIYFAFFRQSPSAASAPSVTTTATTSLLATATTAATTTRAPAIAEPASTIPTVSASALPTVTAPSSRPPAAVVPGTTTHKPPRVIGPPAATTAPPAATVPQKYEKFE